MNKKLLAIAVSAALVAPAAAMAEVKVYGSANVEVASYSEDLSADSATAGNTASDKVQVEDNARGRAGFKASEDLGNGLTGIANFEWKVDTTMGGRDTGQRQAIVGLTGGFGAVLLGNLKSPYKYTGGVKYDPFVTTALEARRHGGMIGGKYGSNSFIDNLVAYASPKGPITVQIAYGPEDGDGAWAADVKYNAGGVEAFVAALDSGDRLGANTYSVAKVGGSYKTGPHKVVFQYETMSNDMTANSDDASIVFLGYQNKMGKNTFVIQASQQTDKDNIMNDLDTKSVAGDTNYMALGVIHKFSKKTRLYAGYRSTSDLESVMTVGLRKDFK